MIELALLRSVIMGPWDSLHFDVPENVIASPPVPGFFGKGRGNLIVWVEIAEPVPSKARNLRVCFGFASQPPKAPRNDHLKPWRGFAQVLSEGEVKTWRRARCNRAIGMRNEEVRMF